MIAFLVLGLSVGFLLPSQLRLEGHSARSIAILEPGTYPAGAVRVEDGELWLGLFDKGDGFELAGVQVSVETVEEPGRSSGERSGLKVEVIGRDRPVLLVRDPSGLLEEGSVSTLFHGWRLLATGEAVLFSLDLEEYRLVVAQQTWLRGGNAEEFVAMILETEERQQLLYSIPARDVRREELTWSLLWAGDLDHDNRLDFYVNVGDRGVSERHLFLSSLAAPRTLVGQAGIFRAPGS